MFRALAFKAWSFEVLISKSLGAWGLGVALSRVIGWTLALRILLGGSWVFISPLVRVISIVTLLITPPRTTHE